MLIVIEGLDGAGTTTQVKRLVEHVRATGGKAHATREPSDGPVGRLIREMLTGGHAIPGQTLAQSTFGLLFAAQPGEDRHERCRHAAGDDDAERQLGDDERGVECVQLLAGAEGARQDPVADQAHEIGAEGQDRQEDGPARHEAIEQVSWVHVAMMTTGRGRPCRQAVGRSKVPRSASTRGRAKQPSRWSLTMPIASIARWTTRLFSACMSGGTFATRWAIASTSSSSRSTGYARLANPAATASVPDIESPVSIASIARRIPINHGCHAMSGDDIDRTGGYPI